MHNNYLVIMAGGVGSRFWPMSTAQKPIVAGNFAKNAAVNYFNYEIHNTLKNADLVDKYGFFVGNHHFDLTEEIHLLHKTIKEFIR